MGSPAGAGCACARCAGRIPAGMHAIESESCVVGFAPSDFASVPTAGVMPNPQPCQCQHLATACSSACLAEDHSEAILPTDISHTTHRQIGAGEAALVLVATPGRLYVFLGGPGLQGAFSGYSSRSFGEYRRALRADVEHLTTYVTRLAPSVCGA